MVYCWRAGAGGLDLLEKISNSCKRLRLILSVLFVYHSIIRVWLVVLGQKLYPRC